MKSLFIALLFVPALAFAAVFDRAAVVGSWKVEGYNSMVYQFKEDGSLNITSGTNHITGNWDASLMRGVGYLTLFNSSAGYVFMQAEFSGQHLVLHEVCQGVSGKIFMARTDKAVSLTKIADQSDN